MTNEILEKGNYLLKNINITEAALYNIKYMLTKSDERIKKDNVYDDGVYSLYIGCNKDNSGLSANLCRYGGNYKLLMIIHNELEQQLNDYKNEFEKL